MEKNKILEIDNKTSLLNQNPLNEDFSVGTNPNKGKNKDKEKNSNNKSSSESKEKENEPGIVTLSDKEIREPFQEGYKSFNEIFENPNYVNEANNSKEKKEREIVAGIAEGDIAYNEAYDRLLQKYAPGLIPNKKENKNLGSTAGKAFRDTNNLFNYSTLGKKSIDIYDYTDYIVNPIRHENIDYQRALNQSNWAKFGNATGRFVAGVVPEFVDQGAKAIEGIFNLFREERGNPISDAMEATKEVINQDWFNIYLKDPNESLAFGDFGWYMDRGSSLGTSITAFLALGYLSGGASLFTRGANLLKAGKVKDFLRLSKSTLKNEANVSAIAKAAGTKDTAKITRFLDQLSSSYLLTNAEGVGVANQVYEESLERKRNELLSEGINPEEAEQLAKQYALKKYDRAYSFNMINVALNMTSVAPFLKKSKIASLNKIEKRKFLNTLKKSGIETVQEAAEEEVNFLAEKFANTSNEQFMQNLSNYIGEDESLEAMLLGAVGGFGQTNLTHAGQYIPTKYNQAEGKYESDYTNYQRNLAAQEQLQTLMKEKGKEGFADFMEIAYSYKKQMDYHGKMSKVSEELKELNKEYEETNDKDTLEKLEKKYEELEAIKRNSFYNRAKNAFDSGLGEDFENMLDAQIESQEKQGNEEQVKDLKKRKKEFKQLEEVYNNTSELFQQEDIFDLASRRINFENMLEAVEDEKQSKKQEFDKGLEKFNKKIKEDNKKLILEEDKDSYKYTTENLNKEKENLDLLEKKLKSYKIVHGNNKEDISLQNLSAQVEEQKQLINILEEETKEVASTALDYQLVLDKMNYLSNQENQLNDVIQELEKQYEEVTSIGGQEKARKKIIEDNRKHKQLLAILEAQQKKAEQGRKKAERNKDKDNIVKDKPEVNPIKTEVDNTSNNSPYFEFIKIIRNISDYSLKDFNKKLNTDNGITNDLYYILKYNNENSSKQRTLILGLTQSYKLEEFDNNTKNIIENFLNALTSKEFNGDGTITNLKNARKSLDKFKDEFLEFVTNIGNNDKVGDLIALFDIENENNDNDISNIEDVENMIKKGDEQADNFMSLMRSLFKDYGLNAKRDSIQKIGETIEEVFGEETFKQLFHKIQGFISIEGNKRGQYLYNTFKRNQNKDVNVNTVDSDSLNTIDRVNKENYNRVKAQHITDEGVIKDEIKYEDYSEEDKVKVSAKSTSIADKIAWKSLEYSRSSIAGFSTKESEGVESFNPNADERLILGTLKKGDKVTFNIIENFTDEKGVQVITEKDKDGNIYTTIKEEGKPIRDKLDPVEYAPIAVSVNGVTLKQGYLHLPSFVNEDNLAGFTEERQEQEIKKLKEIREEAIYNNNFAMTMLGSTKGHLSFGETKTSNKVFDSNTTIGIIGNGEVFSNSKLEQDEFAGTFYTGTVVAKADNHFVYLHRNKLEENEQLINTVAEIIKLKFLAETQMNEQDLANVNYIKQNYDVDLNEKNLGDKDTYVKFNNLINSFILTKSLPYNKKKFNSVLSNVSENNSMFLMKQDTDSLYFQFGVGKQYSESLNLNDNIFFNNDEFFQKKLDNLKFVLSRASINFSGKKLQENKDFSFPILEDNRFKNKTYNTYHDFILDNTSTKIESVDYRGEKVFTFQRSYFMKPALVDNIPKNKIQSKPESNDNNDEEGFTDEDFEIGNMLGSMESYNNSMLSQIEQENIEFKDDNNNNCKI